MRVDRGAVQNIQTAENPDNNRENAVHRTSRARAIALKILLCVGATFGVIAGGVLSAGGLVGVVALTALAVGSAGFTVAKIWIALLAASLALGGGLVYLGATIMAHDKSGVVGLGVGVGKKSNIYNLQHVKAPLQNVLARRAELAYFVKSAGYS